MAFEAERHVQRFGSLSVLTVMATELEYGKYLKQRVRPLITGVGPVEAAVATGAALAALAHTDEAPDLVLSLGSAGSRTLEHAAVYQIESVSYRDMDASFLGFARGVTPFLEEPAVIEIAHRLPDLPTASISTGGAIISGAGYDGIAADMVDMESYAVLRAARRFGVPMIGFRGVSDGRSDLSGLHDWTEYLHVIDERLAYAVDRLAVYAEAGELAL